MWPSLDCFCGRPIGTLIDSPEGNADVMPSKLSLCIGDLATMYSVPWAYLWQHTEWHHDQFSHFCRAQGRDRQTDRPRYSVCSNKPQLTTPVMRPKPSQFDGKYVVLCLHHTIYNHARHLLGAHWFIMAALCNRAGHYIFALWFLSFFIFLSFPRLISATADWMFTVLRHLVWP